MDPLTTLFTFPLKNPKYSVKSELKKTCDYLGIQCHNTNKSHLISILNGYYNHQYLPGRIKIDCYYVNSSHYYKKFIKTYDDYFREVYELDSMIIRYSKIKKEWDVSKRLRTQYHYEELNRLRNIYLYLDFQQLFMNFYLQDILINKIL